VKDPTWKLVLNWGAVITFLSLPLVLFAIQFWNWTHPGFITLLDPKHPRTEFLAEFHRNVTILVFGLAGLRTWEQVKNNGKEKGDKQ
jgi:hypothetical protein